MTTITDELAAALRPLIEYITDMEANGSRPTYDAEMACLRGMWPDSKFFTFGQLRKIRNALAKYEAAKAQERLMPDFTKENQYEFECGVCHKHALGVKGRCVCDVCKAQKPQLTDLQILHSGLLREAANKASKSPAEQVMCIPVTVLKP